MTLKKIRKSLVVLFAVAMVASFATVQVSAVFNGDYLSQVYDSWGLWHRQVDTWASDTTSSNAFYTTAFVYEPSGGIYDQDVRNWPVGTRVGYANAYGPETENRPLAEAYSGIGYYGLGTW